MTSTLPQTLAEIAPIAGWLTDAQAGRLWDAAATVAVEGSIVEIGSFHGRSTIVLARAADPSRGVTAIDPHAGSDRGPQEIEAEATRGDADHAAFSGNLKRAGVADRVRHVRSFSADAQGKVHGPIAVLYVDGAHRYRPASADLRDWGARVEPGGRMLVHDSFSSVGVTLALSRECAATGRWRYRGRDGSLAEYERRADDASVLGRIADTARHLTHTPYFVRNVTIKVLVLARLRPLARLLGLPRDATWPY